MSAYPAGMRFTPSPVTRACAVAVLAAALAAAAATSTAAAAPGRSPAPAPTRLASPDATATQLLNRFFSALVADDATRLGNLLSPAWMIQRASGTWATRSQYLAAMPDVRQYRIVDVMAQYAAPALVVRSRTSTQEPNASGVLVASPLAPRLSTFTWSGGRWRMTSHANFNPPG
jgi:hypothetical protein